MRSVFRNMFVRVSMLVLVVFCLVAFVTLRLKQNDLYAKERALQAEIDRMNEYINELQAEIDRPFDDDYVAEIAHEKLGLRYPQEIVFYSGDEQ
ncbi:MAG: septum formation initiator family protein [Clostridia bacterium]|nr:septum formation initiator family protein [Clostridia bacterium]MBQ3955365.1 septum formation initiator family protein [Clostridia bacterium]